MENTTQANTTPSNGSTIKELMTILKDGEIKDSILSLKTFTGMEIGRDKETQTPVISLYGTKKEETEDNQEEESQSNNETTEDSKEGEKNLGEIQSKDENTGEGEGNTVELQNNDETTEEGEGNPIKLQSSNKNIGEGKENFRESQNNNENTGEEIMESVLKLLGIDFPNHLREATKKPMPVMKLSVPYNNLNDIFTEQVEKYLKANKLSVNAVKGDSEGKFIVMFSNKSAESKFLSDFIKDVEEYKGYTSMDAKNINVARALTNTEIKQIVDTLNTKLPSISKKMLSDSKLQEALKNILGKYTLQFSIDSFIKRDKINESAIKNFTGLKKKVQNLKVEPPFKKWTSGDVKEVAKQKKVSTLPVELEVKVTATPVESQNVDKHQSQQPQVQTVTESILNLLGINLPNHLKEANDLAVANNNIQKKTTEEITPQENNSTEQSNTKETLPANNVPTVIPNKGRKFDNSQASDATYRTANTPAVVNNQDNQTVQNTKNTKFIDTSDAVDATYRNVPPQGNNPTEQGNTQPQENTEESQNTDTKVLTLDSIKILRDYFVKYAQAFSFSIKTKENSELINGLPVVFGNGKDKYLKVDQNGMTGLFTIQAALGEQSTLTKMANWAYKNKDAFTVKNDTSSVSI